jgi:hypothetical protein
MHETSSTHRPATLGPTGFFGGIMGWSWHAPDRGALDLRRAIGSRLGNTLGNNLA